MIKPHVKKHGHLNIKGDICNGGKVHQKANSHAEGGKVHLQASVGVLQNLNLMVLEEGPDQWARAAIEPDQWARTAIIATPEQAQALIDLNNQLENPYQVKGAFLI